jgi:hypothetical protein
VAIRWRLNGGAQPDRTTRPRAIVNDKGLAKAVAQTFAYQPANGIDGATRGEGNYETNWSSRPGFLTHGGRCRQGKGQCRRTAALDDP